MTLDHAFEQVRTAAQAEVQRSRRKLADELHQAVRRLRQAQTEEEILGLLTKSSEEGRVVGVTFEDGQARISASLMFALPAAPALISVIESKDTVVTAPSASELSEPLALALDAEERAHLVPVVVNGAVQFVVVAADLQETAGLEMLCEAAGLRWNCSRCKLLLNRRAAMHPNHLQWDSLSAADQAIHLRAQRFARVAVARMRVDKVLPFDPVNSAGIYMVLCATIWTRRVPSIGASFFRANRKPWWTTCIWKL